MPRTYSGILNIDFTGAGGSGSNEYHELVRALLDLGWTYVETSAFIITTDDINLIWQGIGLVARQDASINADISALTFHIQSSLNFGGIPHTGAAKYPNGLANILAKPFP